MFKIEKFDLLIAIYIFCILISELLGGKTFFVANIGGFMLTSSVAIFTLPFVYSVNDIITEVYGIERSKSVVRAGLLMVIVLVFYTALAIYLPPSPRFAPMEKSYDTVFATSLRISLASLTAFAVAEFTDLFVFQAIRKRLGKKALWLRNNVSNFVSQFADTIIFMFLAFYAFDKPFGDNIIFLFGLIIPFWILKCLMSVIETPLVYAGVKWLKGSK